MAVSKSILSTVLSGPTVRRSLIVALVVGTVLNLINQADGLLAGEVNWIKAGLTYCVPFLVATYGAYCGAQLNGPTGGDRAGLGKGGS